MLITSLQDIQNLTQNEPFNLKELIATFSSLSRNEITQKYELLTQEYELCKSNLKIIFEKWKKFIQELEKTSQISSLSKEFQEVFEKEKKLETEYFENLKELKNILDKIIFFAGLITGLTAENNPKPE